MPRASRSLLATALAVAAGFGRLGPSQRPGATGDAATAAQVRESCKRCHEQYGHTLTTAEGDSWMHCVVDDLLARQRAAIAAGESDYFSLTPHTRPPAPFAAEPSGAGLFSFSSSSDTLKNLLRDYSCDVADGGSQPVRRAEWAYSPPDPCAAPQADAGGGAFIYKRGTYLSAGNELDDLNGVMDVEAALARCEADSRCQGFTFSHAGEPAAAGQPPAGKHPMLFKSRHEASGPGAEWHTYKRRATPLRCPPAASPSAERLDAPPRAAERTFRVDVLRESPPVYVVHDFVSDRECECGSASFALLSSRSLPPSVHRPPSPRTPRYMLNLTLPQMGPSVVVGGGVSTWRQSYSVNMYPDYADELLPTTALARRKFAFARDFVGYGELVENDGQEPINAVYYKKDGDHYGAHCDGECAGGAYKRGHRIASSLAYCEVGEAGGYTTFTRSGLKVVPKRGQLLFFGYKLNASDPGNAMDRGHTEHSGCPLRRGTKWIATMWYREGVTPESDWTKFTV